MSERSDPICFRMDPDDYHKFANYVEDTDLNRSKIAERAANEYVAENTSSLKDKLTESASLAIIVGLPALYMHFGIDAFATAMVVFFVLAPFHGPYIDAAFGAIRSAIRSGTKPLRT